MHQCIGCSCINIKHFVSFILVITMEISSLSDIWQSEGWRPITDLMTDHDNDDSGDNQQPLIFTMKNMLHYFIHREASDGMPNNDSKNVNTRTFPLFKAGHIQYVYYKKLDDKMFVKCSCLPEMKKTLSYSIRVRFTIHNSNIIFAVCGCPAGNGPTSTSKHIGAFCYFLEEFCRLHTVSYSSCTSSLQMWHQPRKRHSTPCTLNNIKFIKAEYGKEKQVISTNYDPRPVPYRGTTSAEITSLQHQLESLGAPVALLHVIPIATATCSTSNSAITRLPLTPQSLKTRVQVAVKNEPQPLSLMSLYKHGMDFLNIITLSKKDISNVEAATKSQSNSRRWLVLRSQTHPLCLRVGSGKLKWAK
uniref:SWIM-type domain-containing protein n=1 Tax=Amphimedon queenslandica TaxID=400682 RepID=A0A1X7VVI1_AMPQE